MCMVMKWLIKSMSLEYDKNGNLNFIYCIRILLCGRKDLMKKIFGLFCIWLFWFYFWNLIFLSLNNRYNE